LSWALASRAAPPGRNLTVRTVAILDQTAALGGAELGLVELLEWLDPIRWRPEVILGNDGPLVGLLHERDASLTVDVLRLPAMMSNLRQDEISTRSLLSPLRFWKGLQHVNRLAERLKQSGAAVIHANSLRACVLGGLAARQINRPCIWQVHSVISEPMMSRRGVQLMRMLAHLLPSWIICNSDATARSLTVNSDRLTVIPCGVDPVRFSAIPETQKRAMKRVGVVARFAPLKGQHIFLDAIELVLPKHPEAQFLLAGAPLFGEETYEAQIRNRASASIARDNIEFPGFVGDVSPLLRSLDVVVHPSIHPEGLGQTVIEAMMCGKPVIASAAGGSAELIEDGVTGRLIPPGDSIALATAIDDLLSHPALASEMGRRARDVAVSRYDIRKTARQIQEVYERVLARV
jgi:glycosyltransferase involved in cell wall biosynthesis